MIIEIASSDAEWVNECNTWRRTQEDFDLQDIPEWFVTDRVTGDGVAAWTVISPLPGVLDTKILVAQNLADALLGRVGLGYGLAQWSQLYYFDLRHDDKDKVRSLLIDLGCDTTFWLTTSLMAPPTRR